MNICCFLFLSLFFFNSLFSLSAPLRKNHFKLLQGREYGRKIDEETKNIIIEQGISKYTPAPKGDEPSESYRIYGNWCLTHADKIKRFNIYFNIDFDPHYEGIMTDPIDVDQKYKYHMYSVIHQVAHAYEIDRDFDDYMLALISQKFKKEKAFAFGILYSTLKLNEENYPLFRKMVKEHCFDVNFFEYNSNESEKTPLHDAVGRQNVPLITLLLELGANPLMKNSKGQTPRQELTSIINFLRSDPIYHRHLQELPVIKNSFTQLAKTGKTLHLMGLISDGGAHSRVEHTQALITIAGQYGIKKIIVHAILDGRDVPQKSAAEFLQRIDQTMQALPATTHAEIGTIQGRLYAMDRNEIMSRLEKAYKIITELNPARGERSRIHGGWRQALDYYYSQALYDEIIPPTQLTQDPTIEHGDGLIFVNIRADRGRELYRLFKNNKNLSFLISGINYENDPHSLPTVASGAGRDQTICQTPKATNTLNDYLESKNIKIFSIAESEKYAHITYFFNGGREQDRPNETRVLIQSDSPESFIDEPAMKACEITHAILDALNRHDAEFYLVNYANADMVGHSGNLQATKKAVSILDQQLKILYDTIVIKNNGTLYITGDHGNAEDKKNNNPAHTTNPVYFLVVSEPLVDKQILANMKTLADVKDIIIQNSFN